MEYYSDEQKDKAVEEINQQNYFSYLNLQKSDFNLKSRDEVVTVRSTRRILYRYIIDKSMHSEDAKKVECNLENQRTNVSTERGNCRKLFKNILRKSVKSEPITSFEYANKMARRECKEKQLSNSNKLAMCPCVESVDHSRKVVKKPSNTFLNIDEKSIPHKKRKYIHWLSYDNIESDSGTRIDNVENIQKDFDNDNNENLLICPSKISHKRNEIDYFDEDKNKVLKVNDISSKPDKMMNDFEFKVKFSEEIVNILSELVSSMKKLPDIVGIAGKQSFIDQKKIDDDFGNQVKETNPKIIGTKSDYKIVQNNNENYLKCSNKEEIIVHYNPQDSKEIYEDKSDKVYQQQSNNFPTIREECQRATKKLLNGKKHTEFETFKTEQCKCDLDVTAPKIIRIEKYKENNTHTKFNSKHFGKFCNLSRYIKKDKRNMNNFIVETDVKSEKAEVEENLGPSHFEIVHYKPSTALNNVQVKTKYCSFCNVGYTNGTALEKHLFRCKLNPNNAKDDPVRVFHCKVCHFGITDENCFKQHERKCRKHPGKRSYIR